MKIPDFQSIMLPLMEIAADKTIHPFRDVINRLIEQFELTEEEKKELLPSGKQPIFENRTGWAKTHLKKAGLLIYPKRGCIQITDRGLSVLGNKPDKIDMKLLKQFDEYNEFLKITNKESPEQSSGVLNQNNLIKNGALRITGMFTLCRQRLGLRFG
jgi:restriction system protein